MAKSNLINSLFKIDAAEGFVRYVNTVKPYHSKILDVLIEYVYKEDVRVRVSERWGIDVGQTKFSPAEDCYYQVIQSLNTPGAGGVITIDGHHQPKFLAGQRMLVTFSDGSSKTYIIDKATNSTVIDPSIDPVVTYIKVIHPQLVIATKTAVTVQLGIAADYSIIGAVTGPAGKWVIEGDFADEFKVGEKIIVANMTPNELGASVYTVAAPPYNGYVPGVGVSLNQLPDYTPDFNIVGVTKSKLSFDADTGQFSVTQGQWVVLGAHADKFVRDSHISVKNEPHTPVYYTVDDVEQKLFSELVTEADATVWDQGLTTWDGTSTEWDIWISAGATTLPDNVDWLQNQMVTVITVNARQQIPETALPSGTLQSPVFPVYEIIGKTATSWTIRGHYADRFAAGDRLFVQDNADANSNKQYIVASAVNNNITYDMSTTIEVVEGVPPSAIANGTIHHPSVKTTIIPVTESVLQSFYEQGEAYRPNRSGTLRPMPLVFNQITQPSTTVVGAVWIDPVTNISKRWTNDGWVHNYTPTQYSWFTDSVNPKQLIVKQAVSQHPDSLDPLHGLSNTMVVNTTNVFKSYTFATTSTQANQLSFARPYIIVGVDPVANKWIVAGDVTTSGETPLKPGETIYITSSSTTQGLGRYVVQSVNVLATTSEVFVTRQISRLATGDGLLTVPTQFNRTPKWVAGTRVKASSTGVLPNPLLASQEYYFIPVIKPYEDATIETPPIFALSKVRHPQKHEDYVDITSFGSGVLSITQDEVYVPGSKVTIRDSWNGKNNGSYTILQTENLSPTETRLYFVERVPSTTPQGVTNDGVLEYDLDSHVYSSLTESKCVTREQTELYAATRITELIQFEFSIEQFDFVTAALRENEPYSAFMRQLGYDVPGHDESGFDGDIVITTSMAAHGSGLTTPVHSMVPIGFDTQFFDIGGIDENTQTVAKRYGKGGL